MRMRWERGRERRDGGKRYGKKMPTSLNVCVDHLAVRAHPVVSTGGMGGKEPEIKVV